MANEFRIEAIVSSDDLGDILSFLYRSQAKVEGIELIMAIEPSPAAKIKAKRKSPRAKAVVAKPPAPVSSKHAEALPLVMDVKSNFGKAKQWIPEFVKNYPPGTEINAVDVIKAGQQRGLTPSSVYGGLSVLIKTGMLTRKETGVYVRVPDVQASSEEKVAEPV